MADTDENREVKPMSQNDRITPTRTSSSEDPDQDTPTTSTECEEVPSAELTPADNAIKHANCISGPNGTMWKDFFKHPTENTEFCRGSNIPCAVLREPDWFTSKCYNIRNGEI